MTISREGIFCRRSEPHDNEHVVVQASRWLPVVGETVGWDWSGRRLHWRPSPPPRWRYPDPRMWRDHLLFHSTGQNRCESPARPFAEKDVFDIVDDGVGAPSCVLAIAVEQCTSRACACVRTCVCVCARGCTARVLASALLYCPSRVLGPAVAQAHDRPAVVPKTRQHLSAEQASRSSNEYTSISGIEPRSRLRRRLVMWTLSFVTCRVSAW